MKKDPVVILQVREREGRIEVAYVDEIEKQTFMVDKLDFHCFSEVAMGLKADGSSIHLYEKPQCAVVEYKIPIVGTEFVVGTENIKHHLTAYESKIIWKN